MSVQAGLNNDQRSCCASIPTVVHSLDSNPLLNDYDYDLRRLIRLQLSDDDDDDEIESHANGEDIRHSRHSEVTANSLNRRRVHFSSTDSNSQVLASPSGKIVSCLPWADEKGMESRYTGRVNTHLQPHGKGVLIYKEGTAKTCIWEDGKPVKSWRPRRNHGKQKSPKPTSCSNADVNANATHLPHLDLGDTGASQDMLQNFDSAKISFLQKHDFAFVLRSNGQWTYAIISDRQMDMIRFVVDFEGRTKTFPMNEWKARIRLVNPSHTKVTRKKPSPSLEYHLRDERPRLDFSPPPPPFRREERRLSLFD